MNNMLFLGLAPANGTNMGTSHEVNYSTILLWTLKIFKNVYSRS